MHNLIFAMVVFAFVGSVTPGPVNIMATSVSMNHGLYSAAKYVSGASFAYALVVFVTGSAINTATNLLPRLELTMQIIGSLFILYLAYKIYSAPTSSLKSSKHASAGFWVGALTQILNPKAWLVAMSGVSLYVIGHEDQSFSLALFTLVSLILCLIGVGIWAVMGTALSKYLNNAVRQRQFNRAMAVLLAASATMIWI